MLAGLNTGKLWMLDPALGPRLVELGGGGAPVFEVPLAQLTAAAAAPGVDLAGDGHDGRVAPTAGGLRDRLVRQCRHPNRQWPIVTLSHAELAELQIAM